MPRKQVNSSWLERSRGFFTNRKLVDKALSDEKAFRELMDRYQGLVTGYMAGFLVRHERSSVDEAEARANEVWKELLNGMPAKLSKKWSEGGTSFRTLLLEGVHEAYYRWQKLSAMQHLLDTVAEKKEWLRAEREGMLDRARERLQSYQRQHTKNGDLSYAIFRLWEQRGEKESQAVLNAKLATIKGMKPINQPDFRQNLKRARDIFGKLLFEEVESWVQERDYQGPERIRQAFEDLTLMEEYACNSKVCLLLLGLTK